MKLCKDCRHAVWPHPIQQLHGASYYEAMCGHPSARRSVVNGDLEISCKIARGAIWVTDATHDARMRDIICGMDAQLFEERPPAPEPPEMKPYQIIPVDVEKKRGWWERIFGG